MSLPHTTKQIQQIVGAAPDGIYGPQTAAYVLDALTRCRAVSGPPDLADADFDERTEKNLATLDPGVQLVMRPFVARAVAIAAGFGVEFKVICGLRDRAAQERARASGASRAGYGHSWHNYGAAIDGGLFKAGRYLDSADPDLAWTIYGAIAEVGTREYAMIWGGSWTSIVDSPHFHPARLGNSPKAEDRRRLLAGAWIF